MRLTDFAWLNALLHLVGLMFAKGEDSRIGVACRWDAVADALNISL